MISMDDRNCYLRPRMHIRLAPVGVHNVIHTMKSCRANLYLPSGVGIQVSESESESEHVRR